MNTPVLLIAHSRPLETERVPEAIVSANAQHVYVATDGPRAAVSTDPERRARVQEVVRAARWPGEVHYLYDIR